MTNGDWAGLALLLVTYLLIFLSKDARNNPKIFAAIVFVLSLHHIIALLNAYGISTIGAGTDARTFYKTAVIISQNLSDWHFAVGAPFYRFLLACVYKIFGPSVLLGEELSILAFLLSCFLFIKIYKLLNYSSHLPTLLVIFGSLPSMVLLTSVMLRESWEMLFFISAIYFCLNNFRHNDLMSLAGYIFSVSMAALFHEGLVVFAFILTGFILVWRLGNPVYWRSIAFSKQSLYNSILVIFTMTVMYLVLQIAMHNAPELEAFHALSSGKALGFIEYFRARATLIDARTSYGMVINTSSIGNFLLTFFPTYLDYMFAPFPWQITNKIDIYAAIESGLRFLLVISAIYALINARGEQRKQLSFLLVVYFLITALWSLGTLNYGTSIRHHLLSYWILVLMFGVYLSQIKERKRVRNVEMYSPAIG